jgi:adenine C2-methylase RlmN of 23S rRNA A2503 and tRNA A37
MLLKHLYGLRWVSTSSYRPAKENLIGIDREILETELLAHHFPRYRSQQIWNALYHNGMTHWKVATNLPATLKAHLAEYYTIDYGVIEVSE